MNRKAAIIAIGSEMLGPTRVDTNSLRLTTTLETYGIQVVRKAVVGDILADLVAEIRHAAGRADLVITTGGLGPTEDDLTREALAEAFGLQLEIEPSIVARIEQRFAARGMTMPEVNRRQAYVFTGQTWLRNERGTAPGHHLEVGGNTVWSFPGVPHELDWMSATYFVPWLDGISGGAARWRRVLKIAGLTESGVEEMLAPYYRAYPNELLTILASAAQIEIHLVASGDEQTARAEIARRETALRDIFGVRILGFDDDTLESVVGDALTARSETLAVAESCTGGLLGAKITDVAGSSKYFLGGGICYTAAAKTAIAGVDPEVIRQHGEVSEEVARAMAEGIRERFGATWGLSVTGIAGPGGGSPEKPVGTVHIAVAGPSGTVHRKMWWQGPRHIIRSYSATRGLDLLRRAILGVVE
jgi:nicotinamide-nucleotide amidase